MILQVDQHLFVEITALMPVDLEFPISKCMVIYNKKYVL